MEQQTQQPSETQVEAQEVKIEDPAAVLGALERAKAEAKKFREEKEKLESDLNVKVGIINDYNNKLLQNTVKSRLEKDGIENPERLLKFVDFEKLQLDAENNLVGFEDQLEGLKTDLPEIFDAKLRVGGKADSAASTVVNTRISATELQARKILGKI
jgi:hypothetical protein